MLYYFRSSQTINQEYLTLSITAQPKNLIKDSNIQEATKLNSEEVQKKKKKRGVISSLKRPLKRFNSTTINPPLPPTPISNNKSSKAPQWSRVDSKESVNEKKSYKKSYSLLNIRTTNHNSNSSIQSTSGGSTFSLNKFVHRKKLKTIDDLQYVNFDHNFLYHALFKKCSFYNPKSSYLFQVENWTLNFFQPRSRAYTYIRLSTRYTGN